MDKKHRYAGAAGTLLFGAAAFCFFALSYPYHIHFQEQFQLFEWTLGYFGKTAAVPGGIADWLGRLLTQFFYYAPAGSLIMALLLAGVQLSCWALCRRKSLTFYALSFLPAIAMLCFFCDENALAGTAVALIASLACGAAVLGIRNHCARYSVELILIPVLYMVAGSISASYILAVSAVEFIRAPRKGWSVAAAACITAALCLLAAGRIFPYTVGRLCSGIHYYRYHEGVPALPWIAAGAAALVAAAAAFPYRKEAKAWPGIVLWCLCATLASAGVLHFSDPAKEEWMKYDFMVRMQMWNRLMFTADAKNPDSPMAVSCLNLALAKSGRMPDHQFEYYQNGPEGLFPSFERMYITPVPTSEIFWHLGMVNTAQRYTFEAQESIPDFQKSARCYKRLAETNIVNGDYDVARKYLRVLARTTFYRKWADETIALLDDGTIFDARPELAAVRNFRFKDHDFLFSDTEMDSMLGLLNVENPDNTLALDYLMSLCLLRKDLDRFTQCIGMVRRTPMPKSYQEALVLKWVQTHSDFAGLPEYIAPVYAQRINSFLADGKAGKDEAYMRKTYGDTYWFYYFYRYKSE